MPRSRDNSRENIRNDRTERRDRYDDKRDRYEDRRHKRDDDKRRDDRNRSPDRRRRLDKSRDDHRRRDSSQSRGRNKDSRDRRRERSSSRKKDDKDLKERKSSSRERKFTKSNWKTATPTSTHSRSQEANIQAIQMPEESSSNDKTFEFKPSYEIMNEFSKESFAKFTRDNGIDFSNIETEEDRASVHEKMQEHLKRHFAAQGKVYPPPPKEEKPAINAATGFANDGSFMEQFKKMQDEYKLQQELERKRLLNEARLKSLPARRRGGKILKTGIVAKSKVSDDGTESTADPWSLYLKEVQKYKNASCDSDSKTRPLVK